MPTNPAADFTVEIVSANADQKVQVVGDQVVTATAADVGKFVTVAADGTLVLDAHDTDAAAHNGTAEAVSTIAATGAAEALSFATPVHDVTMDQNCAFSFTNPAPAGSASSMTVIVRGAFTPTWPVAVDWSAGAAPLYGSPAVYEFVTVDGGVTVFGFLAGASFA